MAELSVIAHPYAQALFSLAKQTKQEDVWLSRLSNLQQVVVNPEFSELLNNPEIEGSQVISVINTLLKDNASIEVTNLLSVLIENNRVSALPEIYQVFRDLVLEDQKRGDAIIESAYAMSQTEKQDFEELLSKKFGKKITAKVVINPELLAGIKVTINDKVIDGSVKGRLSDLSTQLTK
ncbi:MAG: F0F1 ATP synthase subunit delta [Neisseriales bacterium]|jgi:F-type H+-transporting ATPase subunit delta|nr:MAG: F0F1 ATP synthase subunit delta [Neisseriales bacterium]